MNLERAALFPPSAGPPSCGSSGPGIVRQSCWQGVGRAMLIRASSVLSRGPAGSAMGHARGRVSGPLGAAVKLGVPPSTLDSKIKGLKINKYRYKAIS